MGGDVAEHAAQILLEVPAQVARELVDGRGEIGVAGRVHVPPCRFVARGEPQHEAGREPERDGGNGIGGGGGHFTAVENRERKAGGKELEARGLAGMRLQFRARPGRPAQEMVDGRGRGRTRGSGIRDSALGCSHSQGDAAEKNPGPRPGFIDCS